MSTVDGPTVGVVLTGAYWTWAAGTEIYKKFSTFTLLGYPLRQRFSELGGPTYPKFGTVIGLPSLLDKFVLDFR